MAKIDNTRNYIDISPPLNISPGIFPGDTQFHHEYLMSFEKGHHLDLSSVKMSLHTGAHTDAPSHYHAKGKSIDEIDLNIYMGKCQVIEVDLPMGSLITPDDINEDITAQRVLFKTNSFKYHEGWSEDFISLSAELIEFLYSKNVFLIGIDTPSIDPATSKEMLAHKEIYKNNMAILEGIDLEKVIPGKYELNALPLRIENADASPVRAILIDKGYH